MRGQIELIFCDNTTTIDWLIAKIRLIEVGRIVQQGKVNPTQIILNLFDRHITCCTGNQIQIDSPVLRGVLTADLKILIKT